MWTSNCIVDQGFPISRPKYKGGKGVGEVDNLVLAPPTPLPPLKALGLETLSTYPCTLFKLGIARVWVLCGPELAPVNVSLRP